MERGRTEWTRSEIDVEGEACMKIKKRRKVGETETDTLRQRVEVMGREHINKPQQRLQIRTQPLFFR